MREEDLNHNQRYLIEEFAEQYQYRILGRRELLRRVLALTGSVSLTATMLFALGCSSGGDDEVVPTQPPPTPTPGPGVGPGVSASDPAIDAKDIRYPGQAGEVIAYIARPKANGTYPAVVIIHENQGLIEHFKDVARRYAKEGFVGLSVDLLSRQGGTPTDMAAVSAAYRAISMPQMLEDMQSSVNYLKQQTFVKPTAIGVTGFCFGGNETWDLAVNSPDIKAAVPYYGTVADLDALPMTKAAVLAIYGERDTRITATSTEVSNRLRAAGKTVEVKIYPGAGHAFFNEARMNTGNSGYSPEAATAAWNDTLAWFRKYLI